ncbi:ABC transporter ATP-binding protein [Granulosicoccus sp. 3-233]|uniref:ABC transporter ATP-binding protein n=1 Tax=Granulosicoccus sp. 3-233 TaxID=3417969 RepID=UPI003D32A1D2
MTGSLTVRIRQSLPISLDVQLHCAPGELLALVGPSGSGKSTVLRTIAGLHHSGTAHVSCGDSHWQDSEANINLSPQQRRVGMVFQHYALFPHKTVLENVMLAIHDSPREERRRRALEWLARTNMTGLESRKPAQLSGGQRQRVALARALAREPAVLLLDEPFSAVDQQTRRKLYRELAQLRLHLQVPMLLVTHDINEVQQLADSLCLIHRGKSLQQGDVQEVINAPRDKETAKLLGHQNLLPARVLQNQPSQTLYELESGEQMSGPPGELASGSAVILLVPPTTISILDASQPGTSGNCLRGTVSDAVGMGDELSVRLHLETVTKALRFRVPLHVARQSGIRAGVTLDIRIRDTDIHAIAAEPG